jgi:hypothetical protein
MTLGIQKLQGGVPFDVALPNFNSAGIRKPENILAYATLPLHGGSGPLQNEGGPIFRAGTGDTGTWSQGGHPICVSFWIRIPSGGGGQVVSLYNHGYLSGMNVNYNDSFGIAVTETQISMSDNLNNVQNIGFENTRSIGFSKNYNINQQNAGWHHVFATLNRGDETGQLYVDGRNIGWDSITTSGSNAVSNAGEGYSAFSIGGRRIQTQVGVTTQVSYNSLAGEYDICHLGIYQNANLVGAGTNTLYPRFYDPGTTGRLDGTWTPPTGEAGNNYGPAFPYPLLWAEFDFDSDQGRTLKGASLQPLSNTYSISGPESDIFDASETFNYEGTGSGSVSAAP